MNDIGTGRLSASAARQVFMEQSISLLLNQTVPYADKFHFHLITTDNLDLDQSIITEAMIQQAVSKSHQHHKRIGQAKVAEKGCKVAGKRLSAKFYLFFFRSIWKEPG